MPIAFKPNPVDAFHVGVITIIPLTARGPWRGLEGLRVKRYPPGIHQQITNPKSLNRHRPKSKSNTKEWLLRATSSRNIIHQHSEITPHEYIILHCYSRTLPFHPVFIYTTIAVAPGIKWMIMTLLIQA